MSASLLKTGAHGKLKAHGSNGRNSRVNVRRRWSPRELGIEGGWGGKEGSERGNV